MKWFKHFSDASDDEFIVWLESEYGLEGYARWWKLLEAIAAQMDKTDRASAEFSWAKWQQILQGKRNKLETFLEQIRNKSKINLECSGNILKISCPKLLELRDNHTKNLQVTDKPLASQEVEVEVEVDKTQGVNNSGENQAAKIEGDPFWTEWEEVAVAYQKNYRVDPLRPFFTTDHVTRMRKILEVYTPKTLSQMIADEKIINPHERRFFGWFVTKFENLASNNRHKVTA